MSLVPFRAVRPTPLPAVTQLWMRGGTQGKLDDGDVDIMRSDSIQAARKCHGWSPDGAIKYLIKVVNDACDAPIQNSKPRKEPLHRLPYALFCDIDERVFGGVLKGNVHLRFDQKFPSGLAGATIRPSQQEKRRITIELSRDLVFKQKPGAIVEVLLHEMIHAYLLQCCGPQERTKGHDLQHGPEFSSAAFVVVMACGFRQFHQFPSLLGVIAQRRGSGRVERNETVKPGNERSSCYSQGFRSNLCQQYLAQIQADGAEPQIDLDRGCPRDSAGIRREAFPRKCLR